MTNILDFIADNPGFCWVIWIVITIWIFEYPKKRTDND